MARSDETTRMHNLPGFQCATQLDSGEWVSDDTSPYAQHMENMLGILTREVDRLREREATLMEVVRRVAASVDGNILMCTCGMPIPTTRYDTPTTVWFGASAPVAHQPDCVFAQARALLASAEADESAGNGGA